MSLSTFLCRFNVALRGIERALFGALTGQYPSADPELCLDYLPPENGASPHRNDDIFGVATLLFAVPKHRRSLEKRMKRKFGSPELMPKLLYPKKNLQTCNVCGDDHEASVLCPTCYKKVIEETKAMQEAIQAELKVEPVEKEVVVLYQGERANKPAEFWDGKRIVEMEKPRPKWFSDNLLQKTTQKGADTSDVKPSELG